MLYDLSAFQQLCERSYSADDLSMIVAVRAYDGNPWVKERLRKLSGYYAPGPRTIIVDFGSAEPHRGELEAICQAAGFRYVFEADEGVFSLARARNLGAAAATTELLFFSDIDCFGERDLCARLVRQANAVEMSVYFDQMINLPVVHLTEQSSAGFFERELADSASSYLERTLAKATLSAQGTVAEYVDSASNFFVCHRRFFELVGGYNENFRGHGSEDYEFHLRFAVLARQFPLPKKPLKNVYRPLRGDSFGKKRYVGFRRLGELMAHQTEIAGLRIAHLYHHRMRTDDSWYLTNDWGRVRFRAQVEPFLREPWRLLGYDWLPRKKTVLVLLRHRWQYEFFLPLRLAGYRLELATAEPEEQVRAQQWVAERRVEAVAMFNPYMKSHARLRPAFEQARALGLETIVVERGALPESWYYGPDVSYNDPGWSAAAVRAAEFSEAELRAATDYLEQICLGRSALEEQGEFQQTRERHAARRKEFARCCLIPLQLPDDMAVTQYTTGHQAYEVFQREIMTRAEGFPDVLFFIKPHPLMNAMQKAQQPNVVWCGREDNIHALIELSDAVVCYNSGVGLLALLHRKALVTVGNAYYNLEGLGRRAGDFSEAVKQALLSDAQPEESEIVRLLAWLLFRKYSFFKARSFMRDFGSRRSHEYRDLSVYQLSLGGTHLSSRRAGESLRYAPLSYAAGRLGTEMDNRAITGWHLWPLRRLQKLRQDPKRFFQESNFRFLRWLGRNL